MISFVAQVYMFAGNPALSRCFDVNGHLRPLFRNGMLRIEHRRENVHDGSTYHQRGHIHAPLIVDGVERDRLSVSYPARYQEHTGARLRSLPGEPHTDDHDETWSIVSDNTVCVGDNSHSDQDTRGLKCKSYMESSQVVSILNG